MKCLPEPMQYEDKGCGGRGDTSQVAPSTEQSSPGLLPLLKEPRRAQWSQCRPQLPFLPSPSPSHSSRHLESPWLSECFQDTTAASSGQRPAPNRSELLKRVRARVPFTGINLWQVFGCCNLHPEESSRLSRPSLPSLQGRWIGEGSGGNKLRAGVLGHLSG